MTLTATVPDRRAIVAAGRWFVCVLVVVGLHVVVVLRLWHRTEEAVEPPLPSAVLMELAPEPVAPPPPPPEPVVQPTPPLPVEPPPPPVEPPPVETPPVEPPPPEPPPSVEPPAVVLPKPPPPPPAVRPPRPRPHPPAQQTQPTPTPQEPQPAATAAPVRAAPAPNQAPATWQGAVRAHLALFKHYPAQAQRRGEEGVAQVRFVMDHTGRVVSVALVGGSGHSDLDQEALAWIQRAQPFPAPPPEMGQGPVELLVPLRFELH